MRSYLRTNSKQISRPFLLGEELKTYYILKIYKQNSICLSINLTLLEKYINSICFNGTGDGNQGLVHNILHPITEMHR